MTTRVQRGRFGLVFLLILITLFGASLRAGAAPYAALVMDARSGEVLHSSNADTRLHPASLTKMMTLYIAFEAVRRGEVTMDTKFRISKNAASEPPSKLGLKEGQTIELRYLVRAAAVKSANDAATAIGEGIAGSEAAFARRMNRTAKALGMTRSTFKNAHGLTETGHMSTARDMTILGRHLLYDYPQYYNLFSRRTTNAGIKEVPNTNRRLLGSYKGADGIKTGYTRAAGYNLVASAERGRERVIATVFGGRSSVTRNAKVAELLDLGFRRAKTRVAVVKPKLPSYSGPEPKVAAASTFTSANGSTAALKGGKTLRVLRAVKTSPRPKPRPLPQVPETMLLAMKSEIEEAVALAAAVPALPPPEPEVQPAASLLAAATAIPDVGPKPRPARSAGAPEPTMLVAASASLAAPRPKPAEQVVVTRMSTSGGRHWGVNVGQYPNQYKAERMLLKTALKEMATLDGSLRKVVKRRGGYDANFLGLSRDQAALACERLVSRGVPCTTFGPG